MTSSLCKHLAIIMDGNGRWATKRNLPRNVGHEHGAKSAIDIVKHCAAIGMENLTLYCLSTENMQRPELEVTFLINLLAKTLTDNTQMFKQEGVIVQVLGDIDGLGASFKYAAEQVMQVTKNNQGMKLYILCNYSGRWHLKSAFERALAIQDSTKNKPDITQVLEADMPKDPDLLIRTSGEKRLSNFMLYHVAYTELAFDDTYWPDFTIEHLTKHLQNFATRKRRYGQVEREDALPTS